MFQVEFAYDILGFYFFHVDSTSNFLERLYGY